LAARKVEIVPATEAHAHELAPSLRPADAAEVKASGGFEPLDALLASLGVSEVASTLLIDGKVAAIFGVAPAHFDVEGEGVRDVGVVWLLGGTALFEAPLSFLRRCRPVVREFLERYPLLMNAIDARYEKALRWAKWLGFQVMEPVPFGFEGRPFCFISLGRGDCHV
jgi:hypothetical protein